MAAVVDAAVAKYPRRSCGVPAVLVTRAERGDLAGGANAARPDGGERLRRRSARLRLDGALAGIADTCGVLGDARRRATLYPMLLPHARLNVTPWRTPSGGRGAAARRAGARARGDVPAAIAHFEDTAWRVASVSAPRRRRRSMGPCARTASRARRGGRLRTRGWSGRARGIVARRGAAGRRAASRRYRCVRRRRGAARPRPRAGRREHRHAARVFVRARRRAIWRRVAPRLATSTHQAGMLYLQALLAAPGTGIVRSSSSGATKAECRATRRRLPRRSVRPLDLRAESAEADA